MALPFEKTNYRLLSVATGKLFDDSGWLLEAPGQDQAGLVRAVYSQKQLRIKSDRYGIYKFADWLPIQRMLKGSSPPVTFKSNGLAKELGINNLYITFSGYWPEKGAMMRTCSFKETEAYAVCARLDPKQDKVLVVASAGNTARSFARVCADNHIPLLLCVPEDNLDAIWFDEPLNEHVKLVVSRHGGDYYDAIHLSNLACRVDHFIPEGGAKNVARRDGMGTTVLSAVAEIGSIPEYYFQAIGSGTGAIAAWEANLRLIDDGRFGQRKMKLMLSQNLPFKPIADAWEKRSRELLPLDDDEARKQVEQIGARVLSNRRPPYAIAGGLFDALSDSRGEVLTATNDQANEAAHLFQKTEGIDIHPAAAVATASLIKAVNENMVEKDAVIMLNITGGGEEKFRKDKVLYYLKPDIVFDLDPDFEEFRYKIQGLFG